MDGSILVEQDETVLVVESGQKDMAVVTTAAETVIVSSAEQGPEGPPGPPGATGGSFDVAFSYGDASPVLIGVLNGVVISASVVIQTPFNGVLPTLSIGTLTQPSLIMTSAGVFPDELGRFESNPGVTVNDSLYLYITPGLGASQGSGVVYLEVS